MSGSGRLVVISGPSGAGKTSICRRLLARPGVRRVITCTTRPPRAGEMNGVDYLFLSPATFELGIEEGRFLEHASVHGHLYGTPREPVESGIANGETLLLNIDVQGARRLREAGIGGLVTIFIEPPDLDELERRLRQRGTDSTETVRRRVERAREELREKDLYDHIIVNDELERAAAEILEILGEPHPAGS
ncbi:MAG: guanylate kinase [Planctomycetes bacterium]|nr:guanylate kinase [Planctomycetota bacterium]